ncbi:HupE / UreJ protein [Aminobacter sp. MSH1]|uniref:HupE/UreJ family protein n=1 Tax=Aminobacter sp. MSH1 TaxID=374606 RepID=UPI000D3D30EC|nr:HupE/UreJ family protein [Aminobacter sp. MSH1]AWC21298.1 HupE / UreJ protein [Aminobacter sp. MSH1]
MSKFSIRALLTAAVVTLPTLAMAHPGHGEVHGFSGGFAHPLGGLDHVLAMTLVGVLAAQLGGRALWLVPASFVAVLALGGWVGYAGIGLPFVELGIAASIVAFGAIVAFGLSVPVAAAMGLVGFFAIFHGYAHGAEMPESAVGLTYAAGFMVATALLHTLGLVGGLLLDRVAKTRGGPLVRYVGGVGALAGVAILSGML